MPDDETQEGRGPFGTGGPPPLLGEEVSEEQQVTGEEPEVKPAPETVSIARDEWEGLKSTVETMGKRVGDTQTDWQRTHARNTQLEDENRQWREYVQRIKAMSDSAQNFELPKPANPDALLEDGNNIYNFGKEVAERTFQRTLSAFTPAVQTVTQMERRMESMRPVLVDYNLDSAARDWEERGFDPETFKKVRANVRAAALSPQNPDAFEQFMTTGAPLLWAQHYANHEGLPLVSQAKAKARSATPTTPSVPRSTNEPTMTAQDRSDAEHVARMLGHPVKDLMDGVKKRRAAVSG